MKPILGCDAHKRYSVFVRLRENGKSDPPIRVAHDRGAFRSFLDSPGESSEIAIESTGHWYWLVDEVEKAGHHPHLAQPQAARQMMGKSHKTDAIDAKGLAILLRSGTLPEVWIPPGELRDQREILRTRMALRDLRTMLKHRNPLRPGPLRHLPCRHYRSVWNRRPLLSPAARRENGASPLFSELVPNVPRPRKSQQLRCGWPSSFNDKRACLLNYVVICCQ